MRSLKSTTSTSASTVPEPDHYSTAPTTSAAAIGFHRSPWHSPVPYLFGGLAAMLGLMAFALLILVCSYWSKCLSGTRQNDSNEDEIETKKKLEKNNVYEEQFVVILAGDFKPSCLATPAMTSSNTHVDSFNIISVHESSSTTANKASHEKNQNSEDEEHEHESATISIDKGSHSTSSS